MQEVYAKLNACKIKAVSLSLIDTYADQFVDESRTLPIIPDLFETGNLELEYPVHATPDFLGSCDCCGNGCGEVKWQL